MADHEHFLSALEPIYDRLTKYALVITRNREDAEDLVSDTVLIAFENFGAIENKQALLPFLLSIASRLHKRRRYRERMRSVFDQKVADQRHDTRTSPERQAEIRLVYDAMAKLPERVGETVYLFDIADLSMEEIKEIQGGTLSGVKSRLKRGRARLATLLGVEPEPRTRASEKPLEFRAYSLNNIG